MTVEKNADGDLDVRVLVPIKRHELLIRLFKELPVADSFIFINDHDPKPLYYQMEAESKDPFRWEYLEKGPETWKVRVIKVKN